MFLSKVKNFGHMILRAQVTLKKPYVGQLFGQVLRHPTLRCRRGGHALFPASKGPKNRNQKLSSITNIDSLPAIDRFLKFPQKISAQLAKKRMPIYEIIGIFRELLAHNYNLAISQYFLVRPSLFDYYYQISYYLKV